MASSSCSLFFFILLSITLLSLASSRMSEKDLNEYKATYQEKQKQLNESKVKYNSEMRLVYMEINMYLSFIQKARLLVALASVTGDTEPLEELLEEQNADIENARTLVKNYNADMATKFEKSEQDLQLIRNAIRILENAQSEL